MTEPGSQRRREPRRSADGDLHLIVEGVGETPVCGRLIDVSPGGFRAGHDSPELCTGAVVLFRHSGASGRAQVVWNRIVDNHHESGFLMLADQAARRP